MATQTSRLIVSLIDGVTAPARAASRGILGIPRAVKQANGQMTGMTTRLNTAVARNTEALDRMRGRMFDATAGAFALTAALRAPVTAAIAFEAALSDIAAKGDLSNAQVRALSSNLRQTAKETNQTVEALAAGVDYLVGMGMSAEDAQVAIKSIGIASTATGADVTDMAAAAFAALMNLKVPADQTAQSLDAMALAGKRGGFELKDMAQYMPAVAAAYAALGEEGTPAVADLSSALQVMRRDTGDASTAATNLQNVIQKMTSPATQGKFRKMGVDLPREMAKAMVQGLTPLEAIAKITNETLGGDLSKLGYLFEDSQAQAGIRSLIQHQRDYQAIRAEAMKAAGVNQADFERAMRKTEQRIKKLRIGMAGLSLAIGSALLPVFEDLERVLSPVLASITAFAERNSEIVGAVVGITAAFVGLRIALTGLTYLGLMGRGGVLSVLAVGAKALGGTVGYLWGAAKATIALQAALGAMAGGQTLGVLGRIAAGARGMLFAVPGVSMIASALTAVGAAIAGISLPVWGGIAAIAAAIGAAGYSIYRYWDRLSAIFSGVGQALGEIMAPALDAIRPALDWLAPLGDVIARGWTRAKETMASVGEWLGSFFTREVLSEDQKKAMHDAGYNLVMSFWNGMKQVMSDLVAWVQERVGAIMQPFKDAIAFFGPGSATASDSVGSYSEFGDGVDGQRAKGGPISAGGRYLVGENGPEVITPSRSGYVHPNGSGQAGAQVSVTNHFVVNGARDARAVAEEVRDLLDRSARSLFNGVYADTGLSASGG
jgi:TP901 family phage tail tape measure protein